MYVCIYLLKFAIIKKKTPKTAVSRFKERGEEEEGEERTESGSAKVWATGQW